MFQSLDHFQQLRLSRSAPSQFLDFLARNLARWLDKQLLLPSNFGFPHHLGQKAPDDCFNRAAVISSHPFCQLEQLLSQNRSFADNRFNGANAFRVALVENSEDSGEGRLLTKRHAQTRTNIDAFRQRFWNRIIQFAMNRAIDDDTNVPRFRWREHPGI